MAHSENNGVASLPLEAQQLINDFCDVFEERLRSNKATPISDAVANCPKIWPFLLQELFKLEREYRSKEERAPGYPDVNSALTTDDCNGNGHRDQTWPVIAGYELLAEVGEGGMGIVYKARHTQLGRVVALKMMRSGQFAGAAERQRFRIEAEAIAALDHPHIVPVYHVGEVGGEPFLCLKYLDGGSLKDRLDKGTRYEPKSAAKLIGQLARAIHHAHERGVLHRDLKPGNVLLDRDGNPHVADFGLACRLDAKSGLTQTGQLLGTVEYMAPEQARGARDLTTAADVYAIGVILYTMLTGRPPFHGGTPMETLQRVQDGPLRPPSELNGEVPGDLELICLRCLEKVATDRYASAAALADDLDRFLEDAPIHGRKPSITDFFRRIFRGEKETPMMVTLAVFWWFAGLVFVTNALLWLLGEINAPLWTGWLVEGVAIALSIVVNWWYHIRNDAQLNAFERQSMAIHVAHQIVCIALLAMVGPDDPTTASVRALFTTWIPVVMLTTGLAWFAHGPIGGGPYYLFGLAYFSIAVLLHIWSSYAPLVYGTVLSASLLLAGWKTRAMVKRTQSRLDAGHTVNELPTT